MNQQSVSPFYKYTYKIFVRTFCSFKVTSPYKEDSENELLEREERYGYYHVFGIIPNSPSHVIKRAYEEKRATCKTKEECEVVDLAHRVLSDRRLRHRYDLVGKQGMQLLSALDDPSRVLSSGKAGKVLSQLITNFQTNVQDRTFIIGVLGIIFLYVLIQPAVICAKFDEHAGTSYKYVNLWSMTWMLDILIVLDMIVMWIYQCKIGASCGLVDEDYEEDPFESIYYVKEYQRGQATVMSFLREEFPYVRRSLSIFLLMTVQITALSNADRTPENQSNWFAALSPLIVYDLMWFGLCFYHGFCYTYKYVPGSSSSHSRSQ